MTSRQESDRTIVAGGTLLARVLVPAAVVLACSALAAHAVNWSAIGFITEQLEFDDNVRVSAPSPGDVVGSTTDMSLAIAGRSPRAELVIEGGGTVEEYTGPGETRGLDAFDQHVRGDLLLRQLRSTVNMHASFERANSLFTEMVEVPFGEFEELIFTTGNTDRIAYGFGADATIDINRTNQINAAVNYHAIDFARSVTSLVSTENTVVSLGWINRVTDTTQFDLYSYVRFFSADNPTRTRSRNTVVAGRVTTEVNSRLIVYAEAGVSIINTAETVAPAGRQTSTTAGAVYDFGLAWRIDPLTTFTGSVARVVAPSSLGQLQERTGLELQLVHLINSTSDIALGGIYAIQTGANDGASRTFAGFSATYSKRLSRYWHFSLGYRLRINDSLVGEGVSNNVFAALSREFVLLP